MGRILLIFCILIVVVGCENADQDSTKETTSEAQPKENEADVASNESEEETEYTEVVTGDGEKTFRIHNEANLTEREINIFITRDLLKAYESIKKNSFETNYDSLNTVDIYIRNNPTEPSYSQPAYVVLNDPAELGTLVVHELTHNLLGHGKNFGSKKVFLNEGFATYMEYTYGIGVDNSIEEEIRFYFYIDKMIPLTKLFKEEYLKGAYDLFNADGSDDVDSYLRWMSYQHSGGFVKYLIETYGMEKFAELYNQDIFNGSFESVYEKDLKTLEDEWLKHLVPDKEALNKKLERNSVFYEDDYMKIINQIDPSIFEE